MAARKLKTIAAWINEHMAPDLKAAVNMPTIQFRGKRAGHLFVWEAKSGKVVLDHNAADSRRRNIEVEKWLDSWIVDNYPKKRTG